MFLGANELESTQIWRLQGYMTMKNKALYPELEFAQLNAQNSALYKEYEVISDMATDWH